jgi:hypothetical protein
LSSLTRSPSCHPLTLHHACRHVQSAPWDERGRGGNWRITKETERTVHSFRAVAYFRLVPLGCCARDCSPIFREFSRSSASCSAADGAGGGAGAAGRGGITRTRRVRRGIAIHRGSEGGSGEEEREREAKTERSGSGDRRGVGEGKRRREEGRRKEEGRSKKGGRKKQERRKEEARRGGIDEVMAMATVIEMAMATEREEGRDEWSIRIKKD